MPRPLKLLRELLYRLHEWDVLFVKLETSHEEQNIYISTLKTMGWVRVLVRRKTMYVHTALILLQRLDHFCPTPEHGVPSSRFSVCSIDIHQAICMSLGRFLFELSLLPRMVLFILA